MTEYIVRTDKPIRLDEVFHLHGVHKFEVKRMDKHGRLVDADKLRGETNHLICTDCEIESCEDCDVEWCKNIIENAPTVLEASE